MDEIDEQLEVKPDQTDTPTKTVQEARPTMKLLCPERQETADRALDELSKSLATLDIADWKLPPIRIRFTETNKMPPARTAVYGDETEIIFNAKCATPEGEAAYKNELGESVDFPGVQQVLQHELAHIAMWSVTGLSRQPAVRLIDEGWASLVENVGNGKSPDLTTLAKTTKANVIRGLKEESILYKRCLDLSKPISHLDRVEELDRLNGAEYEVGKALLLWIREQFGNEKMLQLIAKSPQSSRRNDTEGAPLEPTAIELSLHSGAKEYVEILDKVTKGAISGERMLEEGLNWERAQFQKALLETTGMTNIREVEADFMKWLQV